MKLLVAVGLCALSFAMCADGDAKGGIFTRLVTPTKLDVNNSKHPEKLCIIGDDGKLNGDFSMRTVCESAGEALNVTALLEAGQDPRDRMRLEVAGLVAYSGFFTTDSDAQNNMFTWYFPSKDGNSSAPLVIWFQGGPGGSSLFGLLAEMGPIQINSNLQAEQRAVTWNEHYAMLFIDNPVGAGFSYTLNDGYCEDETCVGENVYALLQQFYDVFPELLSVPLYVTGESYGGHYVPAVSIAIHHHNLEALKAREPQTLARKLNVDRMSSKKIIPLVGLAIGDGWIDPVNMVPAYPDMLFNQGLCDLNEKKVVEQYCDKTVQEIKEGRMLDAFNTWDEFLNGDIWPYGNYFHNITGLNDYDNYLNTDAPEALNYYSEWLQQADTRKLLHVGQRPFQSGSECEQHLLSDFMVSLRPQVEELLDGKSAFSGVQYKVLIYSGQLDVIIGAALTEAFLPYLQWNGSEAFAAEERKVWRIDPQDKEVAGYATQSMGLTYVIIRAAGHLAPFDQPERSFDMITRFIEDVEYENLPNPQG